MVLSAAVERQPENDEREVGAGQVGLVNETNLASLDDNDRSSPAAGAWRREGNPPGLTLV